MSTPVKQDKSLEHVGKTEEKKPGGGGFVETAKEKLQEAGIGIAHAGESAGEYLKSTKESMKASVSDFRSKYHGKKSEEEGQSAIENLKKATTGDGSHEKEDKNV